MYSPMCPDCNEPIVCEEIRTTETTFAISLERSNWQWNEEKKEWEDSDKFVWVLTLHSPLKGKVMGKAQNVFYCWKCHRTFWRSNLEVLVAEQKKEYPMDDEELVQDLSRKLKSTGGRKMHRKGGK